MEEPDPQVVADAKSGDLRAFEVLVRKYQADVYRFALHLLSHRATAEDVTQETFVRAYRFLRRYRGDARFSTWLFSIARNCVQDEYRRAGRRARLVTRLEEREVTEPRLDTVTPLEVREALQSLPHDLLEPVVMIDIFGLSYREAARALGSPEGTVKSRVHRARERLADAMGSAEGDAADER